MEARYYWIMRAALIAFFVGAHALAFASVGPGTIVEQRLLQNLACTCPVDISTAEKRETAYQDVRNRFAAKYGAAVLTPYQKPTDPRMNWLPIAILVAGTLSLVVVTRRSIKRRRAT